MFIQCNVTKNNKEQTINTSNNMHESQKHAELNKHYTKDIVSFNLKEVLEQKIFLSFNL